MIARQLESRIRQDLAIFPVVALLGPRQAGKTTLAQSLRSSLNKPIVYLDLERPSDLARLQDPELYLRSHAGTTVILDEIQRMPEIFPVLRSLVDERRQSGEAAGHFLILGSASGSLLRQSSESLAGRISFLELGPFRIEEISSAKAGAVDQLWVRGGFPESFLARDDSQSLRWREQFITTYLERDVPGFQPRTSPALLRRLWTMLAHQQGGPINTAQLGGALGVTGKTVARHVDFLTELFLVRQLQPWFRNIGKRLVKSPKLYVRDTGLLHSLTNLGHLETLLGHPLCGSSWEGFAIENLVSAMPPVWRPFYYRTAAGAEIDLILERPDGGTIAIEIKRTLQPSVGRGFRQGCIDTGASERYIAIPYGAPFPLDEHTTALGLEDLIRRFSRM